MLKNMKRELRKEKVAARNQLTREELNRYSHALSQKVVDSPYYKDAQVIFLYRATKTEVRLDAFEEIAKKDGKKLVYPKCISKSEMLTLCPEENAWVKGAYDIWEPDSEHSELINPSDIDLVICPCTVFDENCGRIGMGAGYYDRYLEKCTSAHIVAVAFEVQKAEKIPMDKWDRYMEAVFTEKNVYYENRKPV